MRQFTYHFITAEQTYSHEYSIPDAPLTQASQQEAVSDWTRLDFHRCHGCEWHQTDHCPVAIGLQKPSRLLGKFKSFEPMTVVVESPERTYTKETTVQEGLSGLFGLIMASSGCPAFEHFRGLAWFHLPFASFEETLFRVISSYYLRHQLSGEILSKEEMIADIRRIYDTIKQVNIGITNRLRHGVAPHSDSPMNAVVILDAFGALVPMSVDDGLHELKEIFLSSHPA